VTASKQKDAILRFIKRPASDEAHNYHIEEFATLKTRRVNFQ